MSENNSTMSFDRMRSTLMRAAEIRESEQQQIFDALDEIHARMSPLESLGSVRKRLSELPDRTEVSVLAERLDETLAKLEAQDGAIANLGRAVEGLVDKLAKPFAQLDGRLDGVAGRFEGVAGKMDGLEDKLSGIHKRLDDLDQHVDRHLDKQDAKLDLLPSSVLNPMRERLDALETVLRGRVDEVDEGVHEHLDGTREALQRSLAESNEGLQVAVTEAKDSVHNKLDDLLTRPAVDPTHRLEALAERLEALNNRLESVTSRLDSVEDDFSARLGDLNGSVQQGLSKLDGSLAARPDSDSLVNLVRQANEESEHRHAGQLDEAMATFAELILGGGAPTPPPPPAIMPRQQRRSRAKTNGKSRDAEKSVDLDNADLDSEGV